jgi:streptogramin lyase
MILVSEMKRGSKRLVVPAIILLLIMASVGGFYIYQKLSPSSSCSNPLAGAEILKTQLAPPTSFGGVTEFALPSPLREPSAPTVAADGSVWFAEQSVPGLARFYPNNRTLVEYAWPYKYPAPPSTAGKICGQKTNTWGVVVWDGKMWASDTTGNQIVAMTPSNGQVTAIRLSDNSSFPYTLTPGPNNTLWFTELHVGRIGEISQNGSLREYPLPGGVNAEPTQVIFPNATTGYYSDVGQSQSSGGVYSFNLNDFAPELLGNQHLNAPSSIALGSGALWVALHGSSSVASYNFTTKDWSYYPTTPVSYTATTLPYFVNANGSSVWLNEHFGNRIARIEPANDSMTEYDESNVLVNASIIGNALTFALGDGRAWFAELTGNVLGYVDSSYDPGFSTSIAGNGTVVVERGSSAAVDFLVHDTTHQGELNISFADSESFSSKPSNLSFTAASTLFAPPLGGESSVRVTISASQSLRPGTYGAILTATDGLTYESSFLKIVVPG